MSENNIPVDPQHQPPVKPDFSFGPEIEVEEAGFSFQPIIGFELEVDRSVYMYSDDGKLEISLVGGYLKEDKSITELNDTLAGEFMENFDTFKLIETGTDTIQDVTGFLNRIEFVNAEEEGLGCAMICSPYLNQYFFILVIASSEYWQNHGQAVYEALKTQIRFYPQFTIHESKEEVDEYPDLTIETFPVWASRKISCFTLKKEIRPCCWLPVLPIRMTRYICPRSSLRMVFPFTGPYPNKDQLKAGLAANCSRTASVRCVSFSPGIIRSGFTPEITGFPSVQNPVCRWKRCRSSFAPDVRSIYKPWI